ncbi:MAG: dihydrodipicolinate synthase family protein [Bacteroidales bacterium]|nr:dihydrodipicolinate synthase family protein [Bacteroidales bacterium]
MNKIKGLICAPFTAFDAQGSVDLSKVPLQARFYKDNGVSGVFACGTTGEGSSLTMSEKKALFKEWAGQRSEGFAVIGFLGGTSLEDCKDLARFASEVGLDAVAMTAPYYQRPASVKDLALAVAEVASAVPDMPFFFYHIPILTKVSFPMIRFLEIVDGLIPNFAGIKYTDENMMDYHLCLEYGNHKYNIMWGRDEMLLEALSIGGRTFVGSTYGYMAPVYNAITEAFDAGDMAKAASLQFEAVKLITLLDKYGSGCGKAFMKAAGLDLGPCRRPLNTMDDDKYKAFLEELTGTVFEEFKNIFK